MEHTNGFLSELGKDLSGMERQLLNYHSFNQETFQSNNAFNCNLLSHTEDMRGACDSAKSFEDIRKLIASKFIAVKAAIEIKQKDDLRRLEEANQKLEELQTSLQKYSEEIAVARERADKMEKEALIDSLTGVYNRRAYEIRIREEIRRYKRERLAFGLILIDVDHFKQINDLYGHRVGDKCLRELAGRIRSCTRSTDFLARFGGEEFIIILPGTSAGGAGKIAEKIRRLIGNTLFSYQDEEISVTISVGATQVTPEDEDPELLFTRVDDAMYRAKREGRNQVCVCRL
jgi:diguanylate cyclase (GGDEF)-like protein